MGTDAAPASEVEGALRALRELDEDIEIVLVGDPDLLQAELSRHDDVPDDRLSVHPARERVLAGDPPPWLARILGRSAEDSARILPEALE